MVILGLVWFGLGVIFQIHSDYIRGTKPVFCTFTLCSMLQMWDPISVFLTEGVSINTKGTLQRHQFKSSYKAEC